VKFVDVTHDIDTVVDGIDDFWVLGWIGDFNDGSAA